jgi:hypothetical protein
MKAALPILLSLCTWTAAHAASGEKQSPPPQRRPVAAVSLTFTDDADSVRLPAFASRTTPLPMRFFRIGIEWRF